MLRNIRVNDTVMDLTAVESLFNEEGFKRIMEGNIAHILCREDKKTTFQLTTKTENVYTNGEKIVVGLPEECRGMTYAQMYSSIKACVGHESAHVRWSNFDSLKRYIQEAGKRGYSEQLSHSIFNIIEDGRIERLLCEELPGYAKHIQFLNNFLIKKDGKIEKNEESVLANLINVILFLSVLGVYPTNFEDVLEEKEQKLIKEKIYPLILKGVLSNSCKLAQERCLEILEILKDYVPKRDEFTEALESLLRDLASENYSSSDGEENNNSDEVDSLVENIIREMKESESSSLSSDVDNNGGNAQASSSQKEDDSSKDNKEQDSKDNNGPNSKSSDGESQEGGDSGKSKSRSSKSKNDSSKESDDSSNSVSKGSNNSSKGGEDEGDGGTSQEGKNSEDSQGNSETFKNSFPNYSENPISDISSYESKAKEDIKYKEISQEAQRAFERAERVEREQSKGKSSSSNKDYFDNIDLSEINSSYSSSRKEPNFNFRYPENYSFKPPQPEFRLKINGLKKTFEKALKNDDSNYKAQKRGSVDTSRLWRLSVNDTAIFERKKSTEETDYAVEILIDVSGSMYNFCKYRNAIGTAICVEAALSSLPGVKVKTVTFSYDGYGSELTVWKDFKDTQSKTPNIYEECIAYGCNRDGFAIRVALQDLKKHNAKNKLLIVISDGMPACSVESTDESIEDVKSAVSEGRKFATIASILISDGEINSSEREVFQYMYEKRGSIAVDVYNNPEDIIKNLSLYIKRLFKK